MVLARRRRCDLGEGDNVLYCLSFFCLPCWVKINASSRCCPQRVLSAKLHESSECVFLLMTDCPLKTNDMLFTFTDPIKMMDAVRSSINSSRKDLRGEERYNPYLAVICHYIKFFWPFGFNVCHGDKVLCAQPSGGTCFAYCFDPALETPLPSMTSHSCSTWWLPQHWMRTT